MSIAESSSVIRNIWPKKTRLTMKLRHSQDGSASSRNTYVESYKECNAQAFNKDKCNLGARYLTG